MFNYDKIPPSGYNPIGDDNISLEQKEYSLRKLVHEDPFSTQDDKEDTEEIIKKIEKGKIL